MNREVTVEGRLMSGCNTPAANTTGSFHYTSGMSWEKWAEFTTDENGYFKVKKQIEGSPVDLYVQGSSEVLSGIKLSQKDHFDLGNVYINPFPTNFIINLDVKHPYTENDTLVMFDFNNPSAAPSDVVFFVGPFESGTLDSIVNYNFSQFPISFTENEGLGPGLSIRYMVRSLDNVHIDKYMGFKTAAICSGEFAEVTLVIE